MSRVKLKILEEHYDATFISISSSRIDDDATKCTSWPLGGAEFLLQFTPAKLKQSLKHLQMIVTVMAFIVFMIIIPDLTTRWSQTHTQSTATSLLKSQSAQSKQSKRMRNRKIEEKREREHKTTKTQVKDNFRFHLEWWRGTWQSHWHLKVFVFCVLKSVCFILLPLQRVLY